MVAHHRSPRLERLLDTAAHQLRGPLSVITGMASVLRASEDKKRTREGLETIAMQSARLARMLDNLCALTRFDSATLRREWLPIEDLVGAALARLEGELAEHEVTLALERDAMIHADPILMELVLVNLVEHAVRAAGRSPVEIAARREAVVTVIEIAHRGQEWSVDNPERDGALELAVCRGIADAHGGAVVSWKRDGGGTAVLLTVPDAAPLPEGTS